MLKILIILVFLTIIVSLGTALYQLITHKETSKKTVTALTYRISISLILFIFVAIALMTGIIKPTGIGMHMQLQEQIQQQKNNQLQRNEH